MLSRILKNNKYKFDMDHSDDNFHEEYQYINLIYDVINYGSSEYTRNGNTLMLYGSVMEFDLLEYSIPFLTTKKVAWQTCLKELLWFISGSTDNRVLQDKNVKIWNGNSSRDFLDKVGLINNEEGDLGPIYGFQWRHFNADYRDFNENYENKGIDLLKLIRDISYYKHVKENVNSRGSLEFDKKK